MARYNEILAGRLNRGLQKLLGMKGEPPAPQLASEISPSLMIFRGKEDRYLESWALFAISQSVAAAAGFSGQYKFRNPANSGVVAVFEKLTLRGSTAAADDMRMSIQPSAAVPVDFATNVNNAVLRFDKRGLQATALVLTQQNTTVAPAIFPMVAVNVLQNTSYDVILDSVQEFPLLPGDEMFVWNNNANAVMAAFMWWRERRLEESETS